MSGGRGYTEQRKNLSKNSNDEAVEYLMEVDIYSWYTVI